MELLTIRGAIYGNLIINPLCLSFRGVSRDVQKQAPTPQKYKFGATEFNYYDKTGMRKKWKLKDIKEIVVKRHSLIRQAAEIYFGNSKSIFVSFFTEEYLQLFLGIFTGDKSFVYKAGISKGIVVDNPEEYFQKKALTRRWASCKMSNFEYLMQLNKYAGRSFNDLGQYPVFPWVISEYKHSEKLKLNEAWIYRDLKLPIAGITEDKRREASEKVQALKGEKDLTLFQYGSHYLAARMVLGYLFRLEPYASLLIKFEEGQDLSARMFHMMSSLWEMCNLDSAVNKELIPEFFYLPEMFANYNKCSFGTKRTGEEMPEDLKVSDPRIRVDQAVMPLWAKGHHHFVQMNYLALESKHVSDNLHHWIDLIFGNKQQSEKDFNLFKELCDEETVGRLKNNITHNQVAEIQEFGSNPIRLFTSKHPQRDEGAFGRKTLHAIFPNENTSPNAKFILQQLGSFGAPITYVTASETRLVVVLNNGKVIRSKEGNLNRPLAKMKIELEEQKHVLFPYKRMLEKGNEGEKLNLSCDGRRSFVVLDEGLRIITCRHYDNSCKVVISGEVRHHMYFHKALVQTVCTTWDGDHLVSGSLDGVVAEWNIKEGTVPTIEWFACDHNQGVISLDVSKPLDLLASASLDGTIALRAVSSGKFFRRIQVNLTHETSEFFITQVRLSARGYLLVLARPKVPHDGRCDRMLVYSINGEFIKAKNANGAINCVVINETGYQFITGGSGGTILRYDLLTLNMEQDLLSTLDQSYAESVSNLSKLLISKPSITALALNSVHMYQTLFIGLSSGEMLIYKMVKDREDAVSEVRSSLSSRSIGDLS